MKAPLWLALLTVLSGSAAALDLDYEIGVAARHSDNISLSESDPVSDTMVAPRVFFQASQSGRRVQLSAEGDLQYRHYVSDTFDDELRGSFAGTANWVVLPERLDFVVQDYLSLQPINDQAAFSPANQQQVNIFIAGPTLYARFSPRTRAQIDLRYANAYAEERDDFDSDRFNAAARLVHRLNSNHAVSANFESTDVEFDVMAGASDYRRQDGYVNSTIERNHLDLSLDLGYSRIEFDDAGTTGGNDDESYPLVRARIDWRASPRSVFTTTLNYQLNDATGALITPLEFGEREFSDFRVVNGLVEPTPFRERLARVRYTYATERATLRVTPYHRRIRYLQDMADSQDRSGLSVNLDYRVRPRMTLQAFAVMEDREFVDLGRNDDNLLLSVGLANRFTRHWTGRIDVQRRERDSSIAGRNYDENAVMVSFSYQR
ncbi:MAG: outer membrane beta-barrel protein [Pseudomonadota bacterium]|nr:outer membrane beta-barrel protein [Pseudomonadota bacterium]